jgi:hypothetical protein
MKQAHSQAKVGGAKRFVGKFPSLRLNTLIRYESLIERDFLYLLEFDHNDVVSFQTRPYTIFYTVGDKRLRFIPTIGVVRQHKKQLVEVTSAQRAATETNQLRYRIAGQMCEREGYEFVVVTDEMIRQPRRLNNVKLLIRYQRVSISPQHQILCRELFGGQPEAALDDVFGYFADRNVDKPTVYALLRWGVLDIDLAQPIASDSLVRLPVASLAERRAS